MWYCPSCGKENTGDYCAQCNKAKPDTANTPSFTESTDGDYSAWKAPFLRNEEENRNGDSAAERPSFIRFAETEDNWGTPPPGEKKETPRDEYPNGPKLPHPIDFVEDEDEFHSHPLYFGDSGSPSGNGETETLAFVRTEKTHPEEQKEAEALVDKTAVTSVLTHRKPEKTKEEKTWKISKLIVALIAVISVAVICIPFYMLHNLLNPSAEDAQAPESTGVFYYISEANPTVPFYEEKSIRSQALIQLENGYAVELIEEINDEFDHVYDYNSDQYGYVLRANLVKSRDEVDYGTVENEYEGEKSLGQYYLTGISGSIALCGNSDGSGWLDAQLVNGSKVSLLEKTNQKYWYVFDYSSGERGYIPSANLTDNIDKVDSSNGEPRDKTVISDYYITGVMKYLPIWTDAAGEGSVRGKLFTGNKIGLIQKTNNYFWYVYCYDANLYGYVSVDYITINDPLQTEEEEQ